MDNFDRKKYNIGEEQEKRNETNKEKRAELKHCHRCGTEWISENRFLGRTETCAKCGFYLHCCLNCKLYSPSAPNQCSSPTTELVSDKEKANFCDEFDFAERPKSETDDSSRSKGRKAWDDLFGST